MSTAVDVDEAAILRAQQFALAAHLRDPVGAPPPPDIEDRRLAVYRELFYSSLESLLAGNFPVLRRLLGDESWHATVREFYRDYRCQTPLFTEIGREFLQYLQARLADDQDFASLPPWALELAHYEWVELALDIAEEPDVPAFDADADLLAGAPLRNPLAWPLAYRWPVHALGGDASLEIAPEHPTLLLILRDSDGKVRFKALSGATFRLLQQMETSPTATGREQLVALAAEAGVEDAVAFVREGTQMLASLREIGAVLGVRINAQGNS